MAVTSRTKSNDVMRGSTGPKSQSVLRRKGYVKNDICVKGKVAVNSSK